PAQGLDLLLLLEHGAPKPLLVPREKNKALSAMELWSATRLGNLAAWLMTPYQGRVALAHDSEEPFAHAVVGGVGEEIESERLDAIFLLNHFSDLAREFTLIVASDSTGELLLSRLLGKVIAPERIGRLLLGPHVAVATPVHDPLREQVGWGFASPLGAFRALLLLLRHWWKEEEAAARLQGAIDRALTRRCTPDMGGLHSMFEVTHCILQELRAIEPQGSPSRAE
ncbi:MAG: hypothetical protein H0T73_23330, partial [Ardenticatenales bacterium]|nr:hypothetical protein [Ardenticatenales bacterium]